MSIYFKNSCHFSDYSRPGDGCCRNGRGRIRRAPVPTKNRCWSSAGWPKTDFVSFTPDCGANITSRYRYT